MHTASKTSVAVIMFTLLFMLTTSACSDNNTGISAPPGDKQALEKLAAAYRNQAGNLPVSPAGMNPGARRKFIERVFVEAGYDYSATLLRLSTIQKISINQYHIDLKQLLFMPHHNIRQQDLPGIYSDPEIAAIDSITKNIK